MRHRLVSGVLLLALCALAACRSPIPAAPPEEPPLPETGVVRIAHGELIEIAARDADVGRARAALEEAFTEVVRLRALLSAELANSDLYALNRDAGAHWVGVAPDTAQALARARALAGETGGAFDPTERPLLAAWGMLDGPGCRPSAARLATALGRVGWGRLAVDPGQARARLLEPGMALDLGLFGRGFAADRALERLQRAGVPAALVAIGSVVSAYGGTHARPWRVRVTDPDRSERALVEIPLQEGGVASAAGSRAAPMRRGDDCDAAGPDAPRVALDPRTGEPAEEIRFVAVTARSGALAGGYAAALRAMGEGAPIFAEGHGRVGALVVLDDGETWVSEGLAADWLDRDADTAPAATP